jgi:nucleotide-binding universal stress UspA family protein
VSAARTPGDFASVLVGVDGREGGRDAIALARLLAAPGGKLTLALVRKDGLFPPSAADEALEADFDTPEYEEQQSVLGRERAQAAPDADTVGIVAHRVADGLQELVRRRRADLLVVGSCHRGRPERLLLGNDAQEALHDAPCPVAVAPLGFAHSPTPPRRLGVGYDESPESELALTAARDLAARYRSAVHVLAVQEPDGASSGLGGLAWGEAFEQELATRQQAVTALPGVQGEAVLGYPAEQLVALSGDVDLLVVGSHRRGRIDGLMHQSVSRHLASHAHCPLLVMAPSRAGAHDGASRISQPTSQA